MGHFCEGCRDGLWLIDPVVNYKVSQKSLELTMAAWMLGNCFIFQEYQDIAFLLGYFLAATAINNFVLK